MIKAASSVPDQENIEVLVFSVQNILFAIDGENIDRLITLEEAEKKEIQVDWFHQKITFATPEVSYRNPRVITLAGTENRTGLVIDQPHDFMTVPIRSIRPLPPLFEKKQGLQAFWGAYMKDNTIILLIDFHKLAG
ncbi:MAG: hypothetical protein KKB30_04800 [Proteobacteria bacterium]|nr:hypothetical protein [Pseudomonadota bacterium]MBU1715474.1 hypothetical protein [Pseudomonadota bacterium]